MEILLFGSVIAFYTLVFITLYIILLSERAESSWSIFISIVIFLGIIHFGTSYKLNTIKFDWYLLLYAFYYIVIGILYSLLKTYLTGIELTKKDKEHKKNYTNINHVYSEKDKFNLKDHIYRWILYWWVSLINLVLGKLLYQAYEYLHKKVEKLYTYIWNMSK